VRPFNVVAENYPRLQPGKHNLAAQRNRGAAAVAATACAHRGRAHDVIQEIAGEGQSLHAAPKEHFIAQRIPFGIIELNIDVGIAANASEHRLLRNADWSAQRYQRDVGRPFRDRRGVRAFRVVLQDQIRAKSAQRNPAFNGNRWSRIVIATAFSDVATHMHRHAIVEPKGLISAS
jgi:hypothetical protein